MTGSVFVELSRPVTEKGSRVTLYMRRNTATVASITSAPAGPARPASAAEPRSARTDPHSGPDLMSLESVGHVTTSSVSPSRQSDSRLDGSHRTSRTADVVASFDSAPRPESAPRRRTTMDRFPTHSRLRDFSGLLNSSAGPMNLAASMDTNAASQQLSADTLGQSSSTNGSLAFYFLCKQSPEMTENEDSPFARVTVTCRALQVFAVRSDGFRHTGRGFSGVAHVGPTGVATVAFDNVQANTPYKIGIAFAADAALYNPDTTPPFVDTIVLREAADKPSTSGPVVLRALPYSPWTFPLLRSNAPVWQLAMSFRDIAARTTHNPHATLGSVVTVKHVGDSTAELFIAAVYVAMRAVRRVENLAPLGPLAHVRGASSGGSSGFGAVRGRSDPSASDLFTALTLLGAEHEAAVRKGPWVLDWWDFCLLVLLPAPSYPRLVQLGRQYHATGKFFGPRSGITTAERIAAVVEPEVRPLPDGGLLEFFVPEYGGEAGIAAAAAAAPDLSKSAKRRPQRFARRPTPPPEPTRVDDPTAVPLSTAVANLPRLRPTRALHLSVARMVWSLCSVRQQLLLLRYYCKNPIERTAFVQRYRVRRETDDTEEEGYFDLDPDEVEVDEAWLAEAPAPRASVAPFEEVVRWATVRRTASLEPASESLAATSRLLLRRRAFGLWGRWVRWMDVQRSFRAQLLHEMLRESAESERLQRLRDIAALRRHYRFWCHFSLQGRAQATAKRNERKHALRRFRDWVTFSMPTPFRVKRPQLALPEPKQPALYVAVTAPDAVAILWRTADASGESRAVLSRNVAAHAARRARVTAAAVDAARTPSPLRRQATESQSLRPSASYRFAASTRSQRAAGTPSTGSPLAGSLPHGAQRFETPPNRSIPPPSGATRTPQSATVTPGERPVKKTDPATVSKKTRTAAPSSSDAAARRSAVRRLAKSFPVAAEMLDGSRPQFDAVRLQTLAPMVYALWRVNHFRMRDDAFQRLRVFARTQRLHRDQQAFVDKYMIPGQRAYADGLRRHAWSALRHYRRSEQRVVAEAPTVAPAFEAAVRVVACNGLLDRDAEVLLATGVSDPYVVVRDARKRIACTTSVKDDTLDPVWLDNDGDSDSSKSVARFDVPRDTTAGSVEISVWNKNAMRDDFLGHAALSVPGVLLPLLEGSKDESTATVDKTAAVLRAAGGRVLLRLPLCPRRREPDAIVAEHAAGLGSVVIEVGAADKVLPGTNADVYERCGPSAKPVCLGRTADAASTESERPTEPDVQLRVSVVRCDGLLDREGRALLAGVSDPYVVVRDEALSRAEVCRTEVADDTLAPCYIHDDADAAEVALASGALSYPTSWCVDESTSEPTAQSGPRLSADCAHGTLQLQVFDWNLTTDTAMGSTAVRLRDVLQCGGGEWTLPLFPCRANGDLSGAQLRAVGAGEHPAIASRAQLTASVPAYAADDDDDDEGTGGSMEAALLQASQHLGSVTVRITLLAPPPPRVAAAVAALPPLTSRPAYALAAPGFPSAAALDDACHHNVTQSGSVRPRTPDAPWPRFAFRVHGCCGLLNRDGGGALTGTSDAYVVLRDAAGQQRLRTRTIDNDLSPTWPSDDATAAVDLAVCPDGPPDLSITLDVRNENATRDDFLGRIVVPIRALLAQPCDTHRSVVRGPGRYELRLRPRPHEPDDDVFANAHRLGTLTVSVDRLDAAPVAMPASADNGQEQDRDPASAAYWATSPPPPQRQSHEQRHEQGGVVAEATAGADAEPKATASSISLRVVSASGLVNRDTDGLFGGSLSDPFVRVVAVDGATRRHRHVLQTPTCDDTLHPVWPAESASVRVTLPAATASVRLEVWNANALRDDPLGCALLDLTHDVAAALAAGDGHRRVERTLPLGLRPKDTNEWLRQHCQSGGTLGSITVELQAVRS